MKTRKAKRSLAAKARPLAMRERPKMPAISEEMKQWSAMLKTEVSGWPQITMKPMFGMLALFRRFAHNARHRDSEFCCVSIESRPAGFGGARLEGAAGYAGKTLVYFRDRFDRGFPRRAVVAEPSL